MKEADMETLLKPLASRRRLMILRYLHRGKVANVGNIAEKIGLSFAATSRHLRLLETTGYVEKEQHGLEMHYRIRNNAPIMMHQILRLF